MDYVCTFFLVWVLLCGVNVNGVHYDVTDSDIREGLSFQSTHKHK